MKNLFVFFVLIVLMMMISVCTKDKPLEPLARHADAIAADETEFAKNPSPPYDIPAATVPLINLAAEPVAAIRTAAAAATLEPVELAATLKSGECIAEHKTLHLPADVTPPKGDIMFALDLTGSMGGELSNVKVNSQNIMNQLRGLILDTEFGVISHMDYVGSFSGCGYSSSYGSGLDYPYQLNRPLTSGLADVTSSINSLSLGNGNDGPENYTRVFYESYSDASIGWRPGSKRILLHWLDNLTHDCNIGLDCGTYEGVSTGPDPGRDATAGTSDDLDLAEVLSEMRANNITMIALFSGWHSWLPLWECYAAKTGGDAFLINDDGTVPDGTDIAEFVANLIQEEIKQIDELTLEVCTAGYADWLVSVSPVSYGDIYLDSDKDFGFDINICVPEDAEDGEYCFDICAVGDGVEYARQHVCITVKNEIEVPFDIKPTSCPNPINVKDKGVLSAAILGTADFDVSMIDPETVMLEGVAPKRWSLEDVAAPFVPYLGKADELDCSTEGPDGFTDLTFKFDAQSIIASFGDVFDREVRVLKLTGALKSEHDGTPIVGEDVVIILAGKK